MGVFVTTQILAPHGVPISTSLLGVPDHAVDEDVRVLRDDRGGVLERVIPWGRGWHMWALTTLGLDPFELRTSAFYPAGAAAGGDEDLPDERSCPVCSARVVLRDEQGRVTRDAEVTDFEPVIDYANPADRGNSRCSFWSWLCRVPGTQHVVYVFQYVSERATHRIQGFLGTCDPTTSQVVSLVESVELEFHAGYLPLIDFAEQRQIRYLAPNRARSATDLDLESVTGLQPTAADRERRRVEAQAGQARVVRDRPRDRRVAGRVDGRRRHREPGEPGQQREAESR